MKLTNAELQEQLIRTVVSYAADIKAHEGTLWNGVMWSRHDPEGLQEVVCAVQYSRGEH